MADAIYDKYKQAAIGGGANTDLAGGDVRAILVDTGAYTFAQTHEFLTSVPVGARVAITGALANKDVTDGVFDCDDFTWTAATGAESEAIIFYVHTGSDATARLVCFKDSDTNLPVTPNGGDINYTVNASGVFAI